VLAHIPQPYLYDFSELRGPVVTEHGTFGHPYLDHYFTDAERRAYFVRVGGALAGFTLTRELGDGSREMREFFVLRRHRHRGTGRVAALLTLRRHPGPWTPTYDHANSAAAYFWTPVAAEAATTVDREARLLPDVPYATTRLRFTVAPPPSS
jgi:predicted acetyltransferase